MLRRYRVEVGYDNITRVFDVEAATSYKARQCAYEVMLAFKKWDCAVYDVTEITYTAERKILRRKVSK